MPATTIPRSSTCALLLVCAASVGSPSGTAAQQGPALQAVIVVRHAEKAPTPKENPPLSPAGQARARALAGALRDAGLTAVITTQQHRTRETAAPLLAELHVDSLAVPTSDDRPAHARAVAAAVRRVGGVVLVVDHQLTMPLIIEALGGPRVSTVCDVEFSNLYLLLPAGQDRMRLIRSRYGAPDPPRAADCTITPYSPP